MELIALIIFFALLAIAAASFYAAIALEDIAKSLRILSGRPEEYDTSDSSSNLDK